MKHVQTVDNDSRGSQEEKHNEKKTVDQKWPQVPKTGRDGQVSPV